MIQGDTNPWRDVGHTRWYDPHAALESPASKEFKEAVEDEERRWRKAVSGLSVASWKALYKRLSEEALPKDPKYAHETLQWSYGGIRVDIQHRPGHKLLCWFSVGSAVLLTLDQLSDFGVNTNSDMYYTIEDVGAGAERLRLSVFKFGQKRPLWTTEPVGPTAAFTGEYLYYQGVENYLRYPTVYRVRAQQVEIVD